MLPSLRADANPATQPRDDHAALEGLRWPATSRPGIENNIRCGQALGAPAVTMPDAADPHAADPHAGDPDAGEPRADAPRPTPLLGVHERLGAAMTGFAGWLMPLRYRSETAEHQAVRRAAGLFDLSHMGEIAVTGPGAGA